MKKFFFQFFLLLVMCFFISNLFSFDTGRDYIIHADKALINQQYQNAVDHYLKGINYISEKEKSLVFDDIGYAFLQLRKFDKAVIYLKQAISSNPDDFNPHLYLAAAYYLLEKKELAAEEISLIDTNIHFNPAWIDLLSTEKVENRFGDEVSHHSILRMKKEKGIHIENKGNSQTGFQSQTIYIDALNEDNEGVFYYLASLILKQTGETEKAEEKFQKSLGTGYKPNPNDSYAFLTDLHHKLKDHTHPESWYLYQQHLDELEKGLIQSAVKTLNRALLFDERSLYVNHNLALLNLDLFASYPDKREYLEKAEYFCARSIWFSETLNTDRQILIGCYDLMGNIYAQKKQYPQAMGEFKSILTLDNKNPSAHYNLGCIYYSQNMWPNAELEWKRSIEFEKTENTSPKKTKSDTELKYTYIVPKKSFVFLAYNSLGKLYHERGKQKEAIEEFSMAAKLNPDHPDPYLYLAKIYTSQGKLDTARRNLKQYLYLGGDKTVDVVRMIKELNIQE